MLQYGFMTDVAAQHSDTQPTAHPKLEELIAVLERLRAPGGCAWDREQTHESLVQYLIEETYELVDAIESGNRDELIEELGDVLYQVVFHSDIAAEAGEFTLEDVAAHMTAKMVGRHPHVFGDAVAETAADVIDRWDELKKTEKPGRTSVLDGIPMAMPSLLLADKMLGRAEKVGIARDTTSAVSSTRVSSPQVTTPAVTTPVVTEPAIAISSPAPSPRTEDELGELLLSIVADAKAHGLDSERALRGALRGLSRDIREREAAR